MLEPLGVPQGAEDVYRALLKHGPATETRLADLVRGDRARVAAALADLTALALVRADPGRPGWWCAESPEVTLASLVVQRQEALLERQRELDRAQGTVVELMRLSRQRVPGTEGAVELCPDPETARRRCAHLARTAEESVLALVRLRCPDAEDGAAGAAGAAGSPERVDTAGAPRPAAGLDARDDLTADPAELAALLTRGVAVQVVHERSALLPSGRFEQLRDAVSTGAQLRTLPALPLRLSVYDRANAVVRLDDDATPAALFVHRSELVDGLVTLFDLLWERAVPVPAAAEDDPARDRGAEFDDVLVALLAAGFKDESIARHLGISASTVTRRMSRLMDLTGTSTRFQLGMQAVRRGWI
jgi:predicted transcriptional regulator